MTIEGWYRFDSVGPFTQTLMRSGSGGGNNFGLISNQDDGGKIRAWIGMGGFSSVLAPILPTLGAWTHLALTWNGPAKRLDLFVDGALVASNTSPHTPAALDGTNIEIGTYPGQVSTIFGGRMDQMRVSSVVRYAAAFTPSTVFLPDAVTVALWRADEGSGAQLKDASTNANHIPLFNGPTWSADCKTPFVAPPPTQNPPPQCAALFLDGSNDWIDVPNVPSTTAQTLEAWLSWSASANRDCLLRSNCAGVCANAGKFEIEVYPACNATGTRRWGSIPFTNLPTSPFHFALVSASELSASIYLDGVPLGTTALALDTGVGGVYPGAIGALDNTGTVMDFSPLALFGVRYSSAAKYLAAFTPTYPLPSTGDTALNYLMSDAAGTTVTDASSPQLNGTIYGGATWGTSLCP